MSKLLSCEYNMDTACVELKYAESTLISIDTIAVENEVADNMYQRSELDWLIYNKPLGTFLLLSCYQCLGRHGTVRGNGSAARKNVINLYIK